MVQCARSQHSCWVTFRIDGSVDTWIDFFTLPMAYGNINFLQGSKFKIHNVVMAVLLVWVFVIGGSIFYYSSSALETASIVTTDSMADSKEDTTSAVEGPNPLHGLEAKPEFDLARKIAYISRHDGTTADFKYMVKNLQLEKVDFYNSNSWYDFAESKAKYTTLIEKGERDRLCSEYDAIFVSDSLADGWPLLMGDHKCKNVYFVVTNRFDVGVHHGERNDFYEDVKRALNRKDGYDLKLVVNNLFEIPYMESKGVIVPNKDKIPVIRPFGTTSVPVNEDAADEEPCLIFGNKDQDKVLMHQLVKDNTGFECKTMAGFYGGPKSLSKYNSFVVHLPYQVSIMKMWENLNYGTLMAIPSPQFFTNICDENKCGQTQNVFETKKVFDDSTWHEYVDFYLPGWEKCFLQFDNWDHLKEIIEKRTDRKSVV